MEKLLALILLLTLALVGWAFAGDKYPLTMTAVFTKGKAVLLHPSEMYHSGDYDCTSGDEHNAPECHTALEWAQMDSIAGNPDTVVFTLADGSQVGVHSATIHKIPGFIQCSPGTATIFCDLYFEFLGRQQVNMMKKSKYGQTEFMSSQEYTAVSEARNRELFGNGNTMTLTFRYKLKGKEKDGFQRIEVDRSSCDTGEYGTNHCAGVLDSLNPRGSGYVVGDKAEKQAEEQAQQTEEQGQQIEEQARRKDPVYMERLARGRTTKEWCERDEAFAWREPTAQEAKAEFCKGRDPNYCHVSPPASCHIKLLTKASN